MACPWATAMTALVGGGRVGATWAYLTWWQVDQLWSGRKAIAEASGRG